MSRSGSFAMLAAMRRASSRVSRCRRAVSRLSRIDGYNLVNRVSLAGGTGAMTSAGKSAYITNRARPHRVMSSATQIDGTSVTGGVNDHGHRCCL